DSNRAGAVALNKDCQEFSGSHVAVVQCEIEFARFKNDVLHVLKRCSLERHAGAVIAGSPKERTEHHLVATGSAIQPVICGESAAIKHNRVVAIPAAGGVVAAPRKIEGVVAVGSDEGVVVPRADIVVERSDRWRRKMNRCKWNSPLAEFSRHPNAK